jgi:hypothetical protein
MNFLTILVTINFLIRIMFDGVRFLQLNIYQLITYLRRIPVDKEWPSSLEISCSLTAIVLYLNDCNKEGLL